VLPLAAEQGGKSALALKEGLNLRKNPIKRGVGLEGGFKP